MWGLWVEADQHNLLYLCLGLPLFTCRILPCEHFLLAGINARRILPTVISKVQRVRSCQLFIGETGCLDLFKTGPGIQGIRGLLLRLAGGCSVMGCLTGLVVPLFVVGGCEDPAAPLAREFGPAVHIPPVLLEPPRIYLELVADAAVDPLPALAACRYPLPRVSSVPGVPLLTPPQALQVQILFLV